MANWFTDAMWDLAEGLGAWLGLDSAIDKIQTYIESGENYDKVTAAMRGHRSALNSMMSDLTELLDITQDEINRLMTEKPIQQSPMIQKALHSHNEHIKNMEKLKRNIASKADEVQRDIDQANSDLIDQRNRQQSDTYKDAMSGKATSHFIDVGNIEKGVKQYVQR